MPGIRQGYPAGLHWESSVGPGQGCLKQTRCFPKTFKHPVRPLKPKEIRALRLREGASQAVFARYLNVTTGLVSQWERGEKRPQGPSLKLLSLVAKNGLQAVA